MRPPTPLSSDETDAFYVETAEERIYVHSPPPVMAAPTPNVSLEEEPEREERIGTSYVLKGHYGKVLLNNGLAFFYLTVHRDCE